MIEYIIEPKSRKDIRQLTKMIRFQLGLMNEVYFPIECLLDTFCEIFPDFSYEIVDDETLPVNIHAETDITNHIIRIKESVYIGALNGKGRDRMTIAHEIGHFIMICKLGLKYHRYYGRKQIPAYESPEWQAKCFAGELMIDYDLTVGMNPLDIVSACGVSVAAACYQYEKMHENEAS